ncbi:GPI inositol-deacylase [Rhynchospora pubera]|uniref:GPI inositol-deacylase n=1 Tax=Rhynchospora pubera TaxID=906938 RepID=A0AAV8HJC2_9POAL|nr:GPI inositol-deacylase [Rhynchospora pubera]
MDGFKAQFRLGITAILAILGALLALNQLLKPVPNGCAMTYMYPTYIPIATPANVSSEKYGLFLYHEGWQQIDFSYHLKKLSGVPVLFIPGNGGSYKQVRSLAAESVRAYQGGPQEPTFYQEVSFAAADSMEGFSLPNQYSRMLDWFAVDLEGEHSAMDGRILEEHTEYVVYSIHRILDQYKESQDLRIKEGSNESPASLPTSVILVGHSMGGFVARAALVHPHLRKNAVETILTLSSPHQYPPVALQPSLGHFFSHVNGEWKNGYNTDKSHGTLSAVGARLSNVIVVSVAGGIHDYQVRSKLTSLDGIVPPTHGLTIGSSGMKNVWLSMEHQTILWCNQLVVQVSHTLLRIIDPVTGRPFSSTQKRLRVFSMMLESAVPQALSRTQPSDHVHIGSQQKGPFSCPASLQWDQDELDKDLYIQSKIITVLAMDGRRRWLDIKELGSGGRDHFALVTNLPPCTGVRVHLWPERLNSSRLNELPGSKRIVEVTTKMVHIPAGAAPKQVEPGSQMEQAAPSSFLILNPNELSGFHFLTISVAPRPSISGRPPPAASMAVGQFFNPKEGERTFSPPMILHSSYIPKEVYLEEDHALLQKMSFSVSLGLLPISLSIRTAGCGIKGSTDKSEEEQNRLCKLRCFPPVVLAWDSASDLHVIPNMYSETVVVDSFPALWGLAKGSEKTNVLLLADPHCSYRVGVSVSIPAAASRFFLLYSSQIVGFMLSIMLFALMQQAHAWEVDASVPTVLHSLEMNLRLKAFLLLSCVPLILSMLYSFLMVDQLPSVTSFVPITLLCYLVANGLVILVVFVSKWIFYVIAVSHVLLRRQWQAWESAFSSSFVNQILRFSSSFNSTKIVQIIKGNTNIIVALITIPLVCFVHPAVGLSILLIFHALHAHSCLSSALAANFRSQAQRNDILYKPKMKISSPIFPSVKINKGTPEPLLPTDESTSNSPTAANSFSDSQLEAFNYGHGVFILHMLATLMFVPSLVAWLQRIGMGQNFPWFIDSAVCVGLILHGLFGSKPNINFVSVSLPGFGSNGLELGLSHMYLIAGYYSFTVSMALAPYKAFYPLAGIGIVSFICRIIERKRWDVTSRKSRKHSHKH